jgi:hypothetical protein
LSVVLSHSLGNFGAEQLRVAAPQAVDGHLDGLFADAQLLGDPGVGLFQALAGQHPLQALEELLLAGAYSGESVLSPGDYARKNTLGGRDTVRLSGPAADN